MIGCYILGCIGLYYQWSLSIFKMATSTDRVMLKRKRSAYDASFKLRVVQYAELNNNSAAAREFCIDDRQVRDWRKAKETLASLPKMKKACRGDLASFPEMEEVLYA